MVWRLHYQGVMREIEHRTEQNRPAQAGGQMVSARILVVDDEKLVRRFVAQALTIRGYRVDTVCSAEEGVALCESQAYDVVLTDVRLDGIDGFEMLKRLREIDATAVPVVMTALRDQKTAVRALELGVQDFLIKPFSLKELSESIDHALEERERIVENRLLIGDLIKTRSNLQRQLLERDEKLTQTERYLHNLIDAAPFGVASTDREGCLLTFNDEAERMYGYVRDEVLGRPIAMLVGLGFQSLEEGDATHRCKNGSVLSVRVHIRDILDENTQEIAHLYILEDQSEREMLESQLFQAERLSLLGQMAPRIAHEFKTPLQLISGNAELAKTWVERGDTNQAVDTLDRIMPSVKNLIHLLQQMTNLGKPEKSKQEAIDLGTEVEKVLEALKPLGVVKYCDVVCDIDSELTHIYGDPVQLEQVLRNLIVNAAQAMEGLLKRTLTIRLTKGSANTVVLEVRDTGQGISADILEEIFQPFFTTKPEGKGTGLGLVIVKSILRRHHATIHVESREHEGTAFLITFPAYFGDIKLAHDLQVEEQVYEYSHR